MLHTFGTRWSQIKKLVTFSKQTVNKRQNVEVTGREPIQNYCTVTLRPSDERLISSYNIKKVLKSGGQEVQEGYTCFKTECPVCDTERNSENAKASNEVFINKTTSDFICPKCQHVAKWGIVEKFYAVTKNSRKKDELKKYQDLFFEAKLPVVPPDLPTGTIPVKDISPDDLSELQNLFRLENITEASLNNAKVLYQKENQKIYFPIVDTLGTVIGYKSLQKIDQDIVETTLPAKATRFGTIHLKATSSRGSKESTTCILVLNVFDLLALGTQKSSVDVICLPDGLKSLPQESLPCFERYHKLILWFNYDAAGWDIARNFAKKLEEKRCLFVRPTDSHPTPYKALKAGLDLKSIYTKSQPILHKAITTFTTLRQDVLSELQNIDKVQGVKWQRYPALNKFLKGHRKGELTVLTGPTGCGKTTFMSEYSLDLALQGVTTLWGSFEIRNTRLATTLLRQLAGMPLDENLQEFDFWADAFEKLPIYFMTFHGQQAIKVVMEAIEHAQYVHDIHHVIIDNVQFMMGIGDEAKHIDRFWKQDAIVAAFRTFATKRNCHVTLVIHPRKEKDTEDLTTSSIFGGAKASQEADNVLIIQDKRLTSVRGKKFLQIAKNRYSGDLGIMPLEFDKNSLSYAPKKKSGKVEETDTKSGKSKTEPHPSELS